MNKFQNMFETLRYNGKVLRHLYFKISDYVQEHEKIIQSNYPDYDSMESYTKKKIQDMLTEYINVLEENKKRIKELKKILKNKAADN